MLLNPDYRKFVPKLSDCLSLCSFNQTCAAMSYDGVASTCYMSGKPSFLNISEMEPKAFLKQAHAEKLTVSQCSLAIRAGMLSKRTSLELRWPAVFENATRNASFL